MAQGTYLVVQELRACLLMLKTQVQSLVREQIPHAAIKRSCMPQQRLTI